MVIDILELVVPIFAGFVSFLFGVVLFQPFFQRAAELIALKTGYNNFQVAKFFSFFYFFYYCFYEFFHCKILGFFIASFLLRSLICVMFIFALEKANKSFGDLDVVNPVVAKIQSMFISMLCVCYIFFYKVIFSCKYQDLPFIILHIILCHFALCLVRGKKDKVTVRGILKKVAEKMSPSQEPVPVPTKS